MVQIVCQHSTANSVNSNHKVVCGIMFVSFQLVTTWISNNADSTSTQLNDLQRTQVISTSMSVSMQHNQIKKLRFTYFIHWSISDSGWVGH